MAWLIITLALLMPWLIGLRRAEILALRQLDRLLGRIAIAVRAGAIDPWRQLDLTDTLPFSELGDVLRQARHAGFPILASMVALRRLVARAHKRAQRRRELVQLVRMRISMTVALAAAGRMLILKLTGTPLQLPSLDHGYLLIAALASASAAWLFSSRLPCGWLWQRRLSAEVLTWLRAHLALSSHGFILTELSALSRQELTTGVCLTKEKRRVLIHWAKARGRREAEAYQRCMELLPLFEILSFTLIAGLILAGPALSAWESSLNGTLHGTLE